MALAALCALGAVAVWAYQLLAYLQSGAWVAVSLLDALRHGPESIALWVVWPSGWIGLHKVLGWLPLSAALIALALLLAAVALNEKTGR